MWNTTIMIRESVQRRLQGAKLINTVKQRRAEIGDRRQVMAHSLFIMEKNVAFLIESQC